ncbi:hypothetical protein D9M68_685320 [compost metagenome]
MRGCHRVVFEFAEAAGKRHVLGSADVLIAQKEHAIPDQRLTDGRKQTIVVQRVTQADPDQLGTEGTAQLLDSHGATLLK